MNPSLQSAYILHVRNYRETSGLVDFFTEDDGRINLLAKGYRANTKSRKSFLQPFRKLSISWRGRGELKTLAVAEETGSPVRLENHALVSALYVNELMTRLLQPLDPHPELFEMYEMTIKMLGQTSNLEPVLRFFERNILDVMGYGLQLMIDSEGNTIDENAQYCYIADMGPVKSMKPLQNGVMLQGKTLLSLNSSEIVDSAVLKECKALMRYILPHYTGEKPLKTRELFKHY
ncbi:MAG: DNA repair protein RecO [Gammaproteobacteria bacterium]|nr:DNA repair protein RecO [Gammaproteobacteria bacterium]